MPKVRAEPRCRSEVFDQTAARYGEGDGEAVSLPTMSQRLRCTLTGYLDGR